MHICRVNLKSHSFINEPIPSTWERLGGRGLTARILLDEVPPKCDPLDGKNKLIFAPGLLGGHMVSSCDRLSIGGKSPLTGGVKESNAGGTTGLQMAYLGLKALILEEIPEDGKWLVIHVSKEGIRFESANDLHMLGVYASTEKLLDRFGKDVALSVIGPGGEMQLLAAGIMNIDKDHNPTRISARGGLGAVMGSKHVKAIVFDADGCDKPKLADPDGFKKAQKILTKAILEHPQTAAYKDYGTAGNVSVINMLGALPTRGFSLGRFEGYEKISGETLRDQLHQRGGASRTCHSCMPGCVILSSNVYTDKAGKQVVAPLEYETIGLMGSNLGIDDLDAIAQFNYELNDIGVDTIEIGAALGVAGRAQLFKWGDKQRILELIREIRQGSNIGRIIGNGAASTGKELGITQVPVSKNQAFAAYDPRAIKGTGVTYATSPMGADHTAGLTFRAKVDHLDPAGQAELSKKAQINMAGYDSLGACIFAGFGFSVVPETIKELVDSKYGWNVGREFLQELGRETISIELEFNRQAGLTKEDDRLPSWLSVEKLDSVNTVFDVPDSDLDTIWS